MHTPRLKEINKALGGKATLEAYGIQVCRGFFLTRYLAGYILEVGGKHEG